MATSTLRGPGTHIPPGLLDGVRAELRPLAGRLADDPSVVALLAHVQFALLGEASHGTHDFYLERAELTKHLVREHGVRAVVAEADWPDALRVNRYVQHRSDDRSANEALAGFKRFPTWMWRNTVVLDFVEWLREHNAALPTAERCGFYGMDLYSMGASMQALLDYLDRIDPAAAKRARQRYACFDHFGEDPQAYGYAASFGLQPDCEAQVVQQLQEMNLRLVGTAGDDRDAAFFAAQNARLVHNAEEYYRTMFRGRVSSWNLRDQHMVQTLQALHDHLSREHGGLVKFAVWAHNSHLGDASATEMGDQGEWNVGQLARERWGDAAVLVGFSTHHGTVTAAAEWDAPGERRRVRRGLGGSYEDFFHRLGTERFTLQLRGSEHLATLLDQPRLQRAIGVIYAPHSERMSHYFHTRLPAQFDLTVHLDETRALEPLEPGAEWHRGEEPPETYPSGL